MLRHLAKLLLVLPAALLACTSPTERPDDSYDRGIAARDRGDRRAAAREFQNAIQADRNDFRAHVARQDLMLRESEYPLLQAEYGRLYDSLDGNRFATILRARIESDPIDRRRRLAAFVVDGASDAFAAQAHRDLARLALNAGEPAAAVRHAGLALTVAPRDAATMLLRASALEAAGDADRAYAAYGAAREAGADPWASAAGRARLRIAAGDLVSAERELASVPSPGRRSSTWHLARADLALARGSEDAAAEAFQRAYDVSDPFDRALRRRYGLWLAETGRKRHLAHYLLKDLVDENSSDVELLVVAGRIDLADGRAMPAVLKLDRARQLGADVAVDQLRAWWLLGATSAVARSEIEDDPDARGLRGLAQARIGRHAEAEADLDAALAGRPNDVTWWVGWADLMVATDRAVRVDDRLSNAPKHPAVAAARARAWFARGDEKRADAILDEAISAFGPGAGPAYRQRAAFAMRRGDEEAARTWLERARAGDRTDALTELALLRVSGPTAEATRALERLAESTPRPRGALIRLIEVLLARDEVAKARARADRFAESEPECPEAFTARGLALIAVGRRTDAVREFDQALKRDPGMRLARLTRARLIAADERPERRADAELDFERAVAIDSHDAEARLGLAEFLVAADRLGEARAAIAPLLVGARPSTEALALDARLAESAGEPDAAIESLGRLARLRPDDADVHFRLGCLHAERGDEAKALFYLRRSVKLGGDIERVQPWIRRFRDG